MRSGQPMTAEAKNKKAKTVMLKQKKLYNWETKHFYLYKDVDISNRLPKISNKDNLLTLSKFKDLIQSNINLKKIRNDYNKHLISFYSYFCQQSEIVSKETLEELYLQGFTLEECSEQFNVPKSHMKYLRALYGIKRKGATYINRKKTEPELKESQKQIILGGLLGDAGKLGENSIIRFKQCVDQREYLVWKYEKLKNITAENCIRIISKEDTRYNKINESYRFITSANSFVEECVTQLYTNDKEVPLEYLEKLDALGLAVWYMDDGNTGWSYLRRESTGQNISPELKLCTDSFSLDSINNIIKYLKEKWNINSHYREKKEIKRDTKGQYRIVIDQSSHKEFINIIRPHIIPSMRYKVDYEAYKEYRKHKERIEKREEEKEKIKEDIALSISEETIHSNLFDIYYTNKNFAINIMMNRYDSEYVHNPIECRKVVHVDNFPINSSDNFVKVFTMFEYDWRDKKEQLLNFIKSILKLNSKTAYARKCKVTEQIDKKFYKEHHIQGYGSGTIKCYNLEYDGIIVASIAASKHHRQNASQNALVLNRLCFRDDWNVPGGASKLFKLLKNWAKEEGYDSIISWSDNCWTSGDIYKTLNFNLEEELGPDYFYWDKIEERYRSKQSQKKSATGCPKGKTEREWCYENDRYRLWDRGKKRWSYEL